MVKECDILCLRIKTSVVIWNELLFGVRVTYVYFLARLIQVSFN